MTDTEIDDRYIDRCADDRKNKVKCERHFPFGLEENGSYHEFYSCREMKFANKLSLEEVLKLQIKMEPLLRP